MPRAIASGMCGEKNTGQFSDGMTETEKKRGTGMGYPEMTKFMADCVIVCFFSIWFVLSGSFYLVLSVYLSLCLFVILFPLVSTEERRVDELPVDRLRGSEFLVLYIRGVDRLGERTSTSTIFSSSLPLREYQLLSSDRCSTSC
jgi:hypothetical protein